MDKQDLVINVRFSLDESVYDLGRWATNNGISSASLSGGSNISIKKVQAVFYVTGIAKDGISSSRDVVSPPRKDDNSIDRPTIDEDSIDSYGRVHAERKDSRTDPLNDFSHEDHEAHAEGSAKADLGLEERKAQSVTSNEKCTGYGIGGALPSEGSTTKEHEWQPSGYPFSKHDLEMFVKVSMMLLNNNENETIRFISLNSLAKRVRIEKDELVDFLRSSDCFNLTKKSVCINLPNWIACVLCACSPPHAAARGVKREIRGLLQLLQISVHRIKGNPELVAVHGMPVLERLEFVLPGADDSKLDAGGTVDLLINLRTAQLQVLDEVSSKD